MVYGMVKPIYSSYLLICYLFVLFKAFDQIRNRTTILQQIVAFQLQHDQIALAFAIGVLAQLVHKHAIRLVLETRMGKAWHMCIGSSTNT